ncbi:uncharacterized protein CC84DRAFT_1241772 [Paraphaeosphaeria sporulosa]|uniref:Uncharacterized protein n=1 Tax=Paraphaeosphaeria sporulosa TaxID=1460663 RepID=A0A177CH73_9PLEO|nr:uncharacterized protein CC84DRAFT_1241772 [Paraphaeosphaeria sporulosa]OAG06923.1 hypothetical protein CC84DRAFT_1241772 [Paraphaeosphaeria sporulosa]
MPGKPHYGDVDFLVSGFLPEPPGTSLNWRRKVASSRDALGTRHVPHPNGEHWIQIDIKWAEDAGLLDQATRLEDQPDGFPHPRRRNGGNQFPGSLVFATKQPTDALRILGLDTRFLLACFAATEETCLDEGKHRGHLEDRSGPWLAFVFEWLPQRIPNIVFLTKKSHFTGGASRRGLPCARKFSRCSQQSLKSTIRSLRIIETIEEHRLQQLLMEAISEGQDGWSDEIPLHTIVVQGAASGTPPLMPVVPAQGDTACASDPPSLMFDASSDLIFSRPVTPPHTPPTCVTDIKPSTPTTASPIEDLRSVLLTPIHTQHLPRDPPLFFVARPPANNMSPAAKLDCLAM